jgi:hypothetical protein
MDLNRILERFEQNTVAIFSSTMNLADEQAIWRPAPDEWSILEVINHLHDEECEDFRTRLDLILHRPEDEWPPIDPPGWVIQRRYNARDLTRSLEQFVVERRASHKWLSSLEAPNWDNQSTHPAGFVFSAGDMLASWLAHDFLHIRQLNELHYLYHRQQVEPRSVIYAGEW